MARNRAPILPQILIGVSLAQPLAAQGVPTVDAQAIARTEATIVQRDRDLALQRDRLAREEDLAEIEGNEFNLNIPLYVAPADTGEKITLADALANLEAAHARTLETRAALEAELAKWGLSA